MRVGCQGAGDMARLGSSQISSRVKEALCLTKSVPPAQDRWALAGPSTDVVGVKLPQKRQAPSLTGVGGSVFPLSLR